MGVRIVQVDLAQPLPALRAGRGTGELWILVKLGLQPLGWVKSRPGQIGRSISPELLTRLISDQLSPEIFDAARQRLFESTPDADSSSVSVIVATRENPAALERHLASLARLNHPHFEAIVVDNAPKTDRTQRVCEQFRFVHRVVEPRLGIAYARNTGWQVARNDIVAYADDNAAVDPRWLTAMTANYVAPRVTCVAGVTVPSALDNAAADFFEQSSGNQIAFHRRLFAAGAWHSATWLDLARVAATANFSIRRSALAAVNGFDPALDRGGVLDLFIRVLRDSGSIAYDPRALNFSQNRRTVALLNRQAIDFGFGLAACCSKFFHDTELANASATTLRRWIAEQGIGRIRTNVVAAARLQPHVPLHLILLELAGGILATRAYRRSIQHVKNDTLRFQQKGITKKAA